MKRKPHLRTISESLSLVDGSGSDSEWKVVLELRNQLGSEFPRMLFEHYKLSRNWRTRASCVYHCFVFASTSEVARQLAIAALNDKSRVVRYRACQLLAYSQDMKLLPLLSTKLAEISPDSKDDLLAVVDAIQNQNQNYFVDRSHTGKITMKVQRLELP